MNAAPWLARALSDYKKVSLDLEEYRGRAARAKVVGQAAIDDPEQSEDEAAVVVAKVQVWEARVSSRELEKERLLRELDMAIVAAVQELNAGVRSEWLRRRVVIGTRVRRRCKCRSIYWIKVYWMRH